MLAKDLMHKKVITLSPDMTLREAARVFSDRRITGAPVVTREGRVVGVVSQTDLVREERDFAAPEVPPYHAETDDHVAPRKSLREDLDRLRVEQVMTPWAISFEEDTDVRELARQMLAKHIHRVIITKGGELSGIITSMDMLRAFVHSLGGKPPGGDAAA